MTDSEARAEARRIERAMSEVAEGHDEPLEPDPAPDRTRVFEPVLFTRMRTRWSRDEQDVVEMAAQQVEEELNVEFADAYRILNRAYSLVRDVARDPHTGEPLTDEQGFAIWVKDENGMYREDWSRLTDRDKEDLLHQITTRLVLWEQRSEELRAEALFAKAMWEERFALSFAEATAPEGARRPTEADRTQHAQAAAREQRYLAVYMTVRSNKAQALVRSMERWAMRLHHTLR